MFLRKVFPKRRNIPIVLGFLVVFVLSSLYYSVQHKGTLQNQSHLRGLLNYERIFDVTEGHHEAHFPTHNITHALLGDKNSKGQTVTASPEFPTKNDDTASSLVMEGCPVDWPHQVLRHDSAGMPAAQVCRRNNGDDNWKCAEGWRRVHGDPFCVKYPTSPVTDLIVSSSDEIFDAQTLVSENFKLLFYQLPGTVAEKWPSFFRVLRKNETIDPNLFEHYHKFTFIMHPCLRLIKIWEMISNPSMSLSFSKFLNGRLSPWKSVLLSEKQRLKLQTEMIFDSHRQNFLDQILIFERWNESLLELRGRANMDPKDFYSMRAMSPNNTQCSRLYTQETWLKMTKSYAMDFCVFRYSTSMNESHIIPPIDLTMQAVTSRYNACRQQATKRDTLVRANTSGSSFTSLNPCIIHTYYQPAYEDPNYLLANQNVLNMWEKIWTSAGWQTRVLNESNAMLHPDYENLKEKFQLFPTINAKNYTVGNFIRHIAMAVIGGGWMSDYDVLPLHFPPCSEIPFNGSFTVWSHFVPALVSGHGKEYTRVAHLMADVGLQWRARPDKFIERDGQVQVSDMKTLSVLVKEGHVKSFRVIIETSDISRVGFSCKKTKRSNFKDFPEGTPSLPWGVHLSHAFMSYFRRRNITVVPGVSWEAQEAQNPSFRTNFMGYVYNIYLEECNLK